MYARYLRRELAGRKKQTFIVAAGMAIAIALVMIVNALAAGVKDAQDQALDSVYGVGTDLTITGAQTEPGEGGPGQMFEFDEDAGSTDDEGTTSLSQSILTTGIGRSTLEANVMETVLAVDNVSGATGALSLTSMSFSGELPQMPSPEDVADASTDPGRTMPGEGEAPAAGGGFGGGSFGVNSFSVLGVDLDADALGPLTGVTVSEGRALEADDAGSTVALLDSTYAATADLTVGDSLEIVGEEFEIVGLVSSTSDEADTAANVYLSLDVAQELSGAGDVLSTIYVQATSSDSISAVQEELEQALPGVTVSSQADLASSVSGSLTSASTLINNLGTWLSIVVLAVALALAVLFTTSGVSRRTREFGTLKAIGWSNSRVVRQVAGESLVQSLIGGVVGLALGLGGIALINAIGPTISAGGSGEATAEGMRGIGQGMGAGPFRSGTEVTAATEIVLQAPITLWVIGIALALAVLGGLLAGAFGGWRAARLSPAEALRSVA
ncbi:ABC transporter permease [Serinibacter salmoneus]|uniref:ABC-type lipoprotein release transport system permease subunit n=1 Tax=Serinibacter salmoneus TaxID=556530 RepID=A0A2A9D375_9MICO|nr:ABC transporter permease [Serinibacter salmoneus]PFG21157.1 ABC-type lipoprotein release transport system permease subunit [Serinibacter salmoneus]